MIKSLLAKHKVSRAQIHSILSDIYTSNADFADMYFQYNMLESWQLEDGIIRQGSYHIDNGVGIRVTKDERIGFAYSDALDIGNILNSANFSAKSIVSNTSGNKAQIANFKQAKVAKFYTQDNPLNSLPNKEKISLLKQIDQLARKNSLVVKVNASLIGAYSEVLIANSDGVYVVDRRPMTRVNVGVVVDKAGRIEYASSGGGGRYDYQTLIGQNLVQKFTTEALRLAQVALKSKPAPAGVMSVVLGPGWPGVLLHEAIGHGLEGDFNQKGVSVYSDKLGCQVANPICTIVDNATLKNRRGSLNIDDDGVPSENTTLIENGILKQYMFDKHYAKLMGVKSTGNGRRESYAHLPLPRMTNTYMLAGKDKVDTMITSVDKGIYALNFDGGQVDVCSGKFVFSANEAYLIENGKIKYPIKGATLIGQGDEVLKHISMLGDDLSLDSGVGVCGKEGQNIPVGVGQPSLKIDKLTIGG